MEPIRVLQVVVSMDAGGIETMLMNYYRNIDRSKVQFDFLLHCKHKSHYEDEIEAMGGKIYRVPSYHPKDLFKHKKALKAFFIEHPEYKVVHSHIKFYGLYVLNAAKKAGVPMRIAHSHISTNFYKLNKTLPFRMYTRARFSNKYTHVYACSPEAAEYMAPGKEYTIMNNAVDVTSFVYNASKRASIRREFGLGEETVLGHVGRFSDQKNHLFLIDIFAEFVKLRPDSRLMLVGGGTLLDDVKEKVNALGLDNKVIFTGVRKDIFDLMCAMDMFVFPSKYEGFPVTLVEAQSSDLPCIISDTFSKTAIISDRVQVLSLNDSPTLWAEKIADVDLSLARRDSSELMKEAGMDIRSNAKKIQKVYLEAYGYGE